MREFRREAPARRDQHGKHHGCLWAYLDVLPDVPADLRAGVFAAPRRYPAWIRFSNSNARAQSDRELDGRGVAIKLLSVDGERAAAPVPTGQASTQDFILLGHSAFFARDLEEMTRIFEWQAGPRPRPLLLYFVRYFRLRGLWNILRLASKPESPLALSYFSQTPFQLGADAEVKYRLRPLRGIVPLRATDAERASGNHLRHVLRRQLLPDEGARQLARNGADSPASPADAVFAFEVQRRQPGDDIERSDISWTGPFQTVALLRIPRQDFEARERMEFAERIAFSAWNALREHRPLGKMNWARAQVYAEISRTRHQLNRAPESTYDTAEWNRLRALPPATARTPQLLGDVVATLKPTLSSLPLTLLGSRFGWLVPVLLLCLCVLGVVSYPEQVGRARSITAPLEALGAKMPSEELIPPAIYSARYRATLAKRPHGYRPEDDPDEATWLFRYGSMGAEFSAGIPYWIYRVLPRIAPEQFAPEGDWSAFGLRGSDDDAYYERYHDLPRGLVLSDTVVRLGNQDFAFKLKRVALNCASCHRGEYRQGQETHFVDGMPNLGFDAAAFKRKTTAALTSDAFTVSRVLSEIDRLLAAEHAARGAGEPRLNHFERLLYTQIVQFMQQAAREKSALLGWLDLRPLNGPGRLDAFGAMRFENLGFLDGASPAPRAADAPLYIATVDLPSIWNQGTRDRPRHHYDGNTDDSRARNVGAIVGVGGHPLSVRFESVKRIGTWIDAELGRPAYPFAPIDKARAERGKATYERSCQGCHGRYDARGRLTEPTQCMAGSGGDLAGTDPERLRAIDQPFVEKLNAFGERNALWTRESFRVPNGYLCPPLDGIWARAPYLHNGSVPNLDALLGGKRPDTFVRGNPEYDTEHGGFVSDREPSDGRRSFTFDTTAPGNSAQGHDGEGQRVLDPGARRDLIEYLYSL